MEENENDAQRSKFGQNHTSKTFTFNMDETIGSIYFYKRKEKKWPKYSPNFQINAAHNPKSSWWGWGGWGGGGTGIKTSC